MKVESYFLLFLILNISDDFLAKSKSYSSYPDVSRLDWFDNNLNDINNIKSVKKSGQEEFSSLFSLKMNIMVSKPRKCDYEMATGHIASKKWLRIRSALATDRLLILRFVI